MATGRDKGRGYNRRIETINRTTCQVFENSAQGQRYGKTTKESRTVTREVVVHAPNSSRQRPLPALPITSSRRGPPGKGSKHPIEKPRHRPLPGMPIKSSRRGPPGKGSKHPIEKPRHRPLPGLPIKSSRRGPPGKGSKNPIEKPKPPKKYSGVSSGLMGLKGK